jgi:hypothetical protein
LVALAMLVGLSPRPSLSASALFSPPNIILWGSLESRAMMPVTGDSPLQLAHKAPTACNGHLRAVRVPRTKSYI